VKWYWRVFILFASSLILNIMYVTAFAAANQELPGTFLRIALNIDGIVWGLICAWAVRVWPFGDKP
jgi:hypothetical protein